MVQITGTRDFMSSIKPFSLSLLIFSALFLNSRDELYFGGSSGNLDFFPTLPTATALPPPVFTDLLDILKLKYDVGESNIIKPEK